MKSTGLVAGGMIAGDWKLMGQGRGGKFTIGIIGCGDRGRGMMHVLATLKDQFIVTALCDVLDFRLKAAHKMAGQARTYTDYRQMLADRQLDAVVIAVPLYLHFQIAVAALEAGKHIYLEKTMTYNIEQALSLVKMTAARPRQVLQVGHQYRYAPLYYKVKDIISKGYLGTVSQIDCRWDRNADWRRPVPEPSLEKQINWRLYKAYSGGLVAELLSHQIDFINWAFESLPSSFQATGGIDVFKDGRETYDNVQVMVRYEDKGIIGNFGATCGNAHDGYLFKIKGTKGTISLLTNQGLFFPEKAARKEQTVVDGVSGASKIDWNREGGTPLLPEPDKDGTFYALQDFYRCLSTRKLPDSNIYTGATTAISVDLANQALYSGARTQWNPAYTVKPS